MKIKTISILILFLVLFFSCKEEQKDSYFELKYNLPEYLDEYNFKSFCEQNDISLLGYTIKPQELYLKDSLDITFLNFNRIELKKTNRDFEELVDEAKNLIEEEKKEKWININIGKKQGNDFCFFEYDDVVFNSYNATVLWNFKQHSFRIGFWTDKKNKSKISDFKNLIKNMTYSDLRKNKLND